MRAQTVAFVRIVFLAAAAAMTTVPAESKTCPRPKDRQGRPLYEILTGTLQSSGGSRGGGHFLTLLPMNATTGKVIGGSMSVSIPDKIYAAVQSLAPGTLITLVAYYRSAISGARPAYTCIEVVQEQQNKKG